MSFTDETRPLILHRPQQATESFAEFSVAERERRQNAGGDFDENLFDAAVDLVLRKLRKLEDEGRA